MIGISNNKTTKTDLIAYNGEYILDTVCTSYEITEELNGEYSFDGKFLISDKINKKAYDLLVNDSLLKVDDEYGIEYFRIAKVNKTKTKYEIFARHITISEPLKMFCEDVRPTSLNGQNAISWIADKSRGNKWIEFTSNITNVNTAYYKNKTVYEALFDSDNSFLERWGGEVYRRGFTLSINASVWEDRGFSIRSGKNLKGIEERSNLNTLITSIYPVGFDGISIPEKYINSTNVDYYSDIYPKEVKFDDVKVKGENSEEGFDTLEEAQEELRRRAKEMFTKDKVDILTSSYEVTFAELQKAEGYKNYSFLETTFLGDIVSVYEEKLNIDIKVRVTKRVYDGIKKRRKSTTLSNKDLNYKPPSITQIIDKINKVESTETILQLAKDNATALIKIGLKNSHAIVRENEILIGDTKDINTMIKVWRWNNGGLGYSSTGYFGEYGTAITNDGSIVADFITVGILNANLIKAGLLQSFNGASWLNMENGTFDFANGNFAFDGTNLTMIGKIINVLNGYGVELDKGGISFATGGETVGGIRSASFPSNRAINGITIVNTRDGDFIDFGFTEAENFDSTDISFQTKMRINKNLNEQTGNFQGIQFFDNVRFNNKILYFKSNNENYPHSIFNTTEGRLALFGDNGVSLGYKIGETNSTAIQIKEEADSLGSKITAFEQLNMNGNSIRFVPDIFNSVGTKYYHDGWCGSIESTAKRISNLNAFLDSGWYSFGNGANGAPVAWGVLLHLKLSSNDFSQLVMGTDNKIYTRWWVNDAWTSWVQR